MCSRNTQQPGGITFITLLPSPTKSKMIKLSKQEILSCFPRTETPTPKIMVSILDCPTEILWIIASILQRGDISALTRTQTILYLKLRPALVKYNIRHQNSSALHWAAKNNNHVFVKTLLSYRADVNALHDDFSPLMTAAKYDSELVSDLFLREKSLCVNMRNAKGESALWLSAARESSAVLNQLLQHPRIKIDLPNLEGQTVLWLTVFRANRDLVSLLISRGANLDTTGRYGISPWMQACIRDKNGIKYLLLNHINVGSSETPSKDRLSARN